MGLRKKTRYTKQRTSQCQGHSEDTSRCVMLVERTKVVVPPTCPQDYQSGNGDDRSSHTEAAHATHSQRAWRGRRPCVWKVRVWAVFGPLCFHHVFLVSLAAQLGRRNRIIVEMLGVSKARADHLRREPDFPAPVDRWARGDLWAAADVRRWARTFDGGAARWGPRS